MVVWAPGMSTLRDLGIWDFVGLDTRELANLGTSSGSGCDAWKLRDSWAWILGNLGTWELHKWRIVVWALGVSPRPPNCPPTHPDLGTCELGDLGTWELGDFRWGMVVWAPGIPTLRDLGT